MKHVIITLIIVLGICFSMYCYTNQDNHASIDQTETAHNLDSGDHMPGSGANL